MTITNSSLRLVALVTGVAVALALMGAVAIAPAQAAGLTQTQIQSIVSLLASFGADQATINNVTAALNGQATPGTGGSTGGTTGGACPALTRDLQQGSTGADVKSLQVYLNAAGYPVAASGAGSAGNETTTFGPATKAAVIKMQTAWSITPAAGYVGAKTRAAIAANCGGSTGGNTGGNTGGTTGGSVTVSAAAQPVNSLAPSGASRVPFTTFTISNNTSAPVTVNSVTVQRTGLGVDANFSGVVLLDANGLQIGTAKTLNSNHQANLDGFTLNGGSSMTFTVAGNIADSSTAQSGQIVSLQVVAVNTGATVSGSLPISGASQTINTTLSLGSVSTSTSSIVPRTGSTVNKNLGDAAVKFAGIRFTANSAEDVKLYSIRWRQTGSVGSSDLANIMTNINGTDYPTTVDSTGKYYTTVISGGLMIPKGNSVEAYVKGNIVGSNSVGRTVVFSIDRQTDVYFVGQTYGYGVSFSPSYSNSPWYTGDTFNVQGGTATTIQNASSVPSANIPVNVSNTILGGFQTNFTGEPVTVTSLKFTVASTSSTGQGVTNVSLVDENGTVVGSPVDEASNGTLTFNDSITFGTGVHTYTLKGKVSSGAANGSTITLSTTANSTNWVNATGQISGTTITLPGTSVTMNAMTVQAATSTIAVSSSPAAQTIIAGATGQLLSNIQVDTTQSGEDVRLNSLPLRLTGSAAATALSGCQLYNGTTALTTGSNVQNPSATGLYTFTFDNSLTVPKGTVMTLAVKCNTTTGVTGTVAWGVTASDFSSGSVTGVQSGNSVQPGVSTSAGPTMNLASTASFAVTVDSSSPSRTMVAAGSTGVTAGVVKLHATNGAVILTKLGLKLTAGTYGTTATADGTTSNGGANDVIAVNIYDGTTLVGTASFTGSNTTATSSLSTPVTIPANGDKLLTVKIDVASIGVGQAGGIGDLVKVDPLNAQGTSNGTTVNVSATAGVAGVQLFKSFPTLASTFTAGSGVAGSGVVLKKFTITSNSAGPIGVNKISVKLATSSANATNLRLYAYTGSDYATGPVSSQGSGTGLVDTECASGCSATIAAGSAAASFDASTPIQVNGTVYFSLVGDVTQTGSSNNGTVFVTIQGDSAISTIGSSPTYVATTTANLSSSNFIWSGNSSTTAATTDVDWWNGYFVPGLPSTGI